MALSRQENSTDRVAASSRSDGTRAVSWPVPQAAYVHVPFCRHRCGYCNFSVLAGRDRDYAESYLQALEVELRQLQHPRGVQTLFIGGGTPTHLPHDWLAKLLDLVTHWFPLLPAGEFSVEANPRDIDRQRLQVLAAAGVNRLSLGVQSFDRNVLDVLERDHDRRSAEDAISSAAAVLGNVSVDLIFASPGQRLAQWQHDLDTAVGLPISHISTYGLTFEKGTRFWARRDKGEMRAASEGLELQMYKLAMDRLAAAGFEHYEISNFAKPGFACQHNQAYWQGAGWYAAGPGAARFVDGRREVNHRSPTTYIQRLLTGQDVTTESERLDRPQWAREQLVFGLRMLAGIDLKTIQTQTGIDLEMDRGEAIAQLVRDGWLERTGTRIKLSPQGLLLSDSISAKLF